MLAVLFTSFVIFVFTVAFMIFTATFFVHLMRRASVRRVRMRRARVRRVTRVSLSHSQRDLVAQEVGVMHQVSYSSSVSTFCRNEIKDRNYKSVQQHIFISFSFSGKNGCPPYARCNFRWKFSTAPPKS